MAAKTKTKTAEVVAADETVPGEVAYPDGSPMALAQQMRDAIVKQSKGISLDDVWQNVASNDALLRAIEDADEEQLTDAETDLIQLQKHEPGTPEAEVRGIFMGFSVLEREGFDPKTGEPKDPLKEIWLAVRGSDGEVRPKKMHETATLQSGFAYIAPGTPVRVKFTGSEERTNGQRLYYFDVSKLRVEAAKTATSGKAKK